MVVVGVRDIDRPRSERPASPSPKTGGALFFFSFNDRAASRGGKYRFTCDKRRRVSQEQAQFRLEGIKLNKGNTRIAKMTARPRTQFVGVELKIVNFTQPPPLPSLRRAVRDAVRNIFAKTKFLSQDLYFMRYIADVELRFDKL